MKKSADTSQGATGTHWTFGLIDMAFGLLFTMAPLSSVSAYTVNFVNNTGLPSGYTICAQGYATYTAPNPPVPGGNFMVLSLNGNQASFATTASLSPAPQQGDPLPVFPITPGTTSLNITTNAGTAPILGARVYYYVIQGSSCFPYLYYQSVGNQGSVANDFPSGGAYIFSEITSTNDTTGGQTFDLSMVDSFSLPANATISSTPASYATIGQFDVTLQSAQNLAGIRTDFSSAMSALGAKGQPYLSLLSSTFNSQPSTNNLPGGASVTWPSYAYPSQTAPILNPHSLLSRFIPNPPSPAAPVQFFMPGASSALNYVFDTPLAALFSRTSYLNKTGVSGDTFYATPVSILPLPTGYAPAQLTLLQQNYPNGLPGLALCYLNGAYTPLTCGNQGGTLNSNGWIYNPVNSTVLTTQPIGSQPITGSVTGGSSTLTFDTPVVLPAGVNIYGWYLKVNNSTFSGGFDYVKGCNGVLSVAACTGTLTSVTVDQNSLGGVTQSQVVFGLFPANSSAASRSGSFASSGDQVFGNLGVFGGTLSGSTFAAGIGSPPSGTSGADLGNILVTALNRGVSGISATYSSSNDPQSTDSWQWAQESNWYPGSAVRNEYSFYLHTRALPNSNPNSPLFARPSPSATSANPGGLPMGMAYGFGFDENPAPSYAGAPQVPSEWNQTVGGNILVTFGPWLLTQPSGPFSLLVTKSGTGQSGGIVSSTSVIPTGSAINCGSTCVGTYDSGTVVTLKAQSSATAVFTGWSGAGCSGTGSCVVTMTQSQSVNANFTSPASGNYPLDVSVSGTGSVISTPAGISCTSTSGPCAQEETGGSTVVLTASPAGSTLFLGWTGYCSGTTLTCSVPMTQARTVAAAFGAVNQYQLSVSSGAGGKVTSSPAGIDCGAACLAGFDAGSQVFLEAAPEAGYVFSGWGGSCASFGSGACTLTMNTNRSVTATFTPVNPGEYPLTVTVSGSGSVGSSPAGISCGSNCSDSYGSGTSVSLSATPGSGFQFSGWYGACSGTGSCVVTMDQAQRVTAKFVAIPAPIPALGPWARLGLLLVMGSLVGWSLNVRLRLT